MSKRTLEAFDHESKRRPPTGNSLETTGSCVRPTCGLAMDDPLAIYPRTSRRNDFREQIVGNSSVSSFRPSNRRFCDVAFGNESFQNESFQCVAADFNSRLLGVDFTALSMRAQEQLPELRLRRIDKTSSR